jgi:ElaB/YqjD/DUF883 family membrane-anchored ribosome-binding protein
MTQEKTTMTSITRHETGKSSDHHRTGFADVKEDLKDLKHDAAAYASDIASTGIDAVKHGADKVVETSKKVGAAAQGTHEKVCDYVSKNPTTSVLIAAGVGAVLARVLWRR